MKKKSIAIDSVRASRDGHEFHEVWAARKALQLLLPVDNLVGIAIEGLHPADQARAASETVEIADIVLYYGKGSMFKYADIVKIVQFKYSITSNAVDFRASHAKKTLRKFATAYSDHKKKYDAKDVRDKLRFELITNRPIYPAFEQAISNIVNGKPLSGEVKKQADQFEAACGLNGDSLVEFAGKCLFTGFAGSLNDTKRDLSRTLVDWSATSDAIAVGRLGEIKRMVRDKAGSAGTNKNVIRRADVLDVLGIPDIDELLPCPPSLPNVGAVVEREQLAEAIALIPKLDKPLLIHAAGGMGKTVFMESLAKALSDSHQVVFFDCFGGGAYRAPDDSRHLPKRGLLQIVNTLAFNSLCDPILPDNNNVDSLVRTFRRRLSQCVKTLSIVSADKQLILFIDAIDNAAQHARDRKESAFPTLLLETFHHNGIIPGVKLVVSCRSHRIDMSTNDIQCHNFKLEPFSLAETGIYLRTRLNNVTQPEIQIAQSRSRGNARILDHLITSNRGLLDPSEIHNPIGLDELLSERIKSALSEAVQRGSKKGETDAFLAGLSILPPPVPLEEYAGAHGLDLSAIESFAADLAPLLERTKYGLMFRDEPTETLIRDKFGSDKRALRRVAMNLLARQGQSVYAARALPDLLRKLDDGKRLFELAFNEKFPESITSTVGKRNIRYARLKAAVLHAANNKDHNRLVHLLIELSTLAAVDQRGTDYILDNPDLVIAANDADATRRLFEIRTEWPGTRHARLAIANTLSGDFDDAYRHAKNADEWLFHFTQQGNDRGIDRAGPEHLDIAAIPSSLIAQNRAKNAIGFMRGWKHWYVYEVGEYLFSLLAQVQTLFSSGGNISEFLNKTMEEIGLITSALSFQELDRAQQARLINKLSRACKKEKKLEMNNSFPEKGRFRLQDGLLKVSLIAASHGLKSAALAICQQAPHERPRMWSFQSHFSNEDIFPFLVHVALIAAIKRKKIQEQDIFPKELVVIFSGIRNAGNEIEFKNKLKKCLEKYFEKNKSNEDNRLSYDEKQNAENFINDQLTPLLKLTKAFSELIAAPFQKGDETFLILLKVWEEAIKENNRYSIEKFNRFFLLLGRQFAIFAIWARADLKATSIEIFLKHLHEQELLDVSILIKLVSILAKRSNLHGFAGKEAVRAKSLIDNEDDVGSKASFYAKLGRAILPASVDEAIAYFKLGLEQMDAIGSGDYQFTNELLLVASSLRGEELIEKNFHTLSNICELNMYDEEKFPWFTFAKGLSRISGCKTLAKLSRWDDRSKVFLNWTLLPYLTALLYDKKIEPEIALALNKLANSAELYSCNTATLAKAIDEENYPNRKILINELIQQFEVNNSGIPSHETVKALASIAERALDKGSVTTLYLSAAHEHFRKVIEEQNEHMNYHGRKDRAWVRTAPSRKQENNARVKRLIARTTPIDEASMEGAIDELNKMKHIYDLKTKFFDDLRLKVSFSKELNTYVSFPK